MASAETILDRLAKLIDLEREFDVEETGRQYRQFDVQKLQEKGLLLLNLRITGRRTGIGGKSVVDFETGLQGMVALPAHKFRQGDIVSIEQYSSPTRGSAKKSAKKSASKSDQQHQQESSAVQAVVARVSDYQITIVLNGNDDKDSDDELDDAQRYLIKRLACDLPYDRMKKALSQVKDIVQHSTHPLVQVLFGVSKPESLPPVQDLPIYDQGLNEPQREAVRQAMAAKNVCLIHGPPGTGKTTTLVEIIRHLVDKKERILVCAPSNVAVDNIIERLPARKDPQTIIRIGHPCRVLPSAIDYSLDVQLQISDAGQLVADIRKEMDATLRKIGKCKVYAERKALYAELKALRKELRVREPQALNQLIKNAEIICTTLMSAGSHLLRDQEFDTVIIDEATQSLEPECWIAITKARKLILAGDPHQLPPTITSPDAAKKGLSTTLFDRIQHLYGGKVTHLLSIQYRMHPLIMEWSSKAMYNGKLQGGPNVSDRLLHRLEHVQENDDTRYPLILIDTAGCNVNEVIEEDGESKYNEGEANLAKLHCEALVSAGLSPDDIAIITPYNAQVQHLRGMLKEKYPTLEIGSVDGFQGREKEAIILTLVRSNDKGEVGFLAESRRLNVAITRAKRQVTLICDTETVGRDKFMKEMIDYFNQHADVRYAYFYEGFDGS